MISYSLISDKGSRKINEDSVSVSQNGGNYCFTLCDGLGGHGNGDVASAEVTGIFSELFKNNNYSAEEFFAQAYSQANNKVLELQKENGSANGMKTTVVSLVISNGECRWSHLGDSRLYCFGKRSIKARTYDHSVPQMLVVSKEIKEREIRFHPDRNKILRAIGADEETPKYQLSDSVKIEDCEAFLLCSDGFWELISERRMCSLLKRSKSVKEWLEAMQKAVIKKGKNINMDNYSAIAVIIG